MSLRSASDGTGHALGLAHRRQRPQVVVAVMTVLCGASTSERLRSELAFGHWVMDAPTVAA